MPTRRAFLNRALLTGAATLLSPAGGATEPAPETTKIKLLKIPVYGNCIAPLYVAEELLQSEGFTDVQYVTPKAGVANALMSGDVDIGMSFIPQLLTMIDDDAQVVVLSGGHVGCVDFVATEQIRSIRDLKGKTVGVTALRPHGADYVLAASFLAYVGLHPHKDVQFVAHPFAELLERFAAGQIDALPLGPPESFEFRAKRIGHVLMNNAKDRPWSKYFCCAVSGYRDFVQAHPVATKRVLRAILKSADICAFEPERVARFMVEKGYTPRYEHALATLKELPYGRWREYDTEDSVRFYALRLRDVGMVKSSPQRLMARGTDWRFLNELKKELKT